MKIRILLTSIIFSISCVRGLSEGVDARKLSPAMDGARYLQLTPQLDQATLDRDYATIPFLVKNCSKEDVAIARSNMGRIDCLMTFDENHQGISIRRFLKDTSGGSIWNQGLPPIILKPGQTEVYQCSYPMAALAAVANRNKEVFGAMTGYISGTNQKFRSYSVAFKIPVKLTKVPWVDLGDQHYFTVTPDLAETEFPEDISGGSIWIPVKITNTSELSCIPVIDHVAFEIIPGDKSNISRFLWVAIKTTGPILKPGDSRKSEGRSYIAFKTLNSMGYKPGDTIIAAIAGRIPDTNQVFECYSQPFQLPPLRIHHPSK